MSTLQWSCVCEHETTSLRVQEHNLLGRRQEAGKFASVSSRLHEVTYVLAYTHTLLLLLLLFCVDLLEVYSLAKKGQKVNSWNMYSVITD